VKTLVKEKIVSYDDKIDVEKRTPFNITLKSNQTPNYQAHEKNIKPIILDR